MSATCDARHDGKVYDPTWPDVLECCLRMGHAGERHITTGGIAFPPLPPGEAAVPAFMEPLDKPEPPVQSKAQARLAALEQSAQVLTAQLGRARFNYLVQKKAFEVEEARIMYELEKHGHAIGELRVTT